MLWENNHSTAVGPTVEHDRINLLQKRWTCSSRIDYPYITSAMIYRSMYCDSTIHGAVSNLNKLEGRTYH